MPIKRISSPALGLDMNSSYNLWPIVSIPLEDDIAQVIGGESGTHVRASNGLYTDPITGLITTAGVNIPRFEEVGGRIALLDEPAGTNLIQYSHELGNAASAGWWSDFRLTSISANGDTAPDGNVVADGLVADVNDNTHLIQSTLVPGIAQDDKVAITVFAKPGNKNWVRFEVFFYDVGDVYLGDRGYYFFDISTGTIGTPGTLGNTTIHGYKIESAANGYYRIGLIISNSDANTSKVIVQLQSAHADNDNTFAGDATTVNTWFWSADLKKQAYFDSHVPTSGATATRATESGYPLWTLPTGLFDDKGTAIVWVRFGYPYTAVPNNTQIGIVATRDGVASLFRNEMTVGGVAKIRSYDATNTATYNLDWLANTWYKLVVKWSSTTSKMRVGVDIGAGIVWGTEVAFDGSYTLGANLRLAFGLFGPMWIRDLRLYDRVLTDAEINVTGSP